jgi:hypothetical protein
MRRFLTNRGPAIAFWLLALAAQLSGYTNTAIAFALVGAAAFFLMAPVYHHIRAWLAQTTMGTAQLILLAGLIGTWLSMTAAIGAAGWMIWVGQGFAIGSSAIGRDKDDGPMQWFRTLKLEGGFGRNVFSLTFRGVNSSQKEVELKTASIISALNGAKLPLEIVAQNEIVRLNEVELIPPGAVVELVAKFGPPDPNASGKILGVDPKAFVETWKQFSLNVQDDSKSYRIPFNEGDLAPFFPGMVGPHVSKKASASN